MGERIDSSERGPRGLPAKYLTHAPDFNRCITYDEENSKLEQVWVSTYAGAVDSFQKIYLRLEQTSKGGFKVAVYQAEQAIGKVAWPEMYRVTDWLSASFDGGLYLVNDYSWDLQGLHFVLRLPTKSQLNRGPDSLDLLPKISQEVPIKFLFPQELGGLDLHEVQLSPGDKFYGRLQLRRLAADQVSIRFGSEWSMPVSPTPEMLEILRGNLEVEIFTNVSLSAVPQGTELEVLDSFRSPVLDYSAISISRRWPPTGAWILNESDLLY